jgi:cytochrome c oxidase assembly protein subunit 15
VQAVFGGLTVLFRLPDAVSTTHLGLALLFLSLAVVLAASTSPRRATRPALSADTARALRRWGSAAAGLVFVQSLLGGIVRHTDAGMACPDVPTCLGAWIPPMGNELVALHFTHRVLAVLVTIAVVALTVRFTRPDTPRHVRAAALLSLALVVIQVTLGILSVVTILGVTPVSLHTLGAASLLATLVLLSTWGFEADGTPGQPRHTRDRQAAEV